MDDYLIGDIMQCYILDTVIAVGVEAAVEMDLTFFKEVPLDHVVSIEDAVYNSITDMEDHEFCLTFKGMWYAHRLVKLHNIKNFDDLCVWNEENER